MCERSISHPVAGTRSARIMHSGFRIYYPRAAATPRVKAYNPKRERGESTSLPKREPHMNAVDIPVRETNRKRWMLWAGWVLSVWPVFVVLTSATWKLTRNPWYVGEFARIGWPDSALPLLAGLQLGCIILYVIPQTAVLGAVLLTGYLGGAIATYTRIGEAYPVLVPLSTSVIAWAGIYLRDERLRALLPLRTRVPRS